MSWHDRVVQQHLEGRPSSQRWPFWVAREGISTDLTEYPTRTWLDSALARVCREEAHNTEQGTHMIGG